MKDKILAIFMAIIVLSTIAIPVIGRPVKEEPTQVNIVEIVDDLGEVIIIEQEGNPSTTTEYEEIEKLVSELEESISKLEELSHVSDEALVAEYVKQEILKLRSDVEGLDIHPGIKNSLLVKLNATLERNDKAIQFIQDGKEKQADNMLNATSNILDAFISEVGALSDKKITEEDAKSLVQQAQKIIESIEGGAQWIVEEKIYVEVIQQPRIPAEIEKNVVEMREIIAELQALGVQVDVIFVEKSPAVPVIVVAGVKYVILPAAASALMTYGFTLLLEEYIGPICWSCKLEMMAIGAVAGAVGVPAMKLGLIKLGLGITSTKEALVILGGVSGLRTIMLSIWKVIGKCDDPECIFYKPVVPPVIYEQTITNAPGMDEYRWYNQDFGWAHTFDSTGKRIISATLEIRALDVDWGEPWYMEHDIIYTDGHKLTELKGWSGTWSTTTFEIDPALATEILEDEEMYVFVDIDSTHTYRCWAVTIDYSKLTIEYTTAGS